MSAEVKQVPANNPLVTVSSRITGCGMSVPSRVIPNEHFASYLETSDEWIRDRTGIRERRWVEGDVSASDLAEPACLAALKQAGLTINDIDGIVVATVTPDYVFPSTACSLQRRLGVTRGFAFDINAVCSGFVYALTVADSLIARRAATNMLVVGVDLFSKLINPNDRGTCVLFGDGAGAVVLSAVADPKPRSAEELFSAPSGARSVRGIYGSILRSDGNFGDILCVPQGTAKPATPASIERGEHFLTMAGKEVFKLAVRYLGEVTEQLLTSVGQTVQSVDHFVSHQANQRILSAMARQLGVPESKVLSNVSKYGNTSAASVPILLAEANADGTLKAGDLVVLSAVGGGLTWGAVLIRW